MRVLWYPLPNEGGLTPNKKNGSSSRGFPIRSPEGGEGEREGAGGGGGCFRVEGGEEGGVKRDLGHCSLALLLAARVVMRGTVRSVL